MVQNQKRQVGTASLAKVSPTLQRSLCLCVRWMLDLVRSLVWWEAQLSKVQWRNLRPQPNRTSIYVPLCAFMLMLPLARLQSHVTSALGKSRWKMPVSLPVSKHGFSGCP